MRNQPAELSDYEETWALQREIHAQVASGELGPQVLFVEHPPVYTAGRRTLPIERPRDGTPVIDVDRGGKITWHGPGQLVGYPIVRLPQKIGPLGYVRRLEEAIMRVIGQYGVRAGRVDGRTGVWLPPTEGRPERKLCAIGIRVSKQTTMHGFALNVRSHAHEFDNIIPCGISDAAVGALEAEVSGGVPSLVELAEALEPELTELLRWQPFETVSLPPDAFIGGPSPLATGQSDAAATGIMAR